MSEFYSVRLQLKLMNPFELAFVIGAPQQTLTLEVYQ
jgi:hypothetical protein